MQKTILFRWHPRQHNFDDHYSFSTNNLKNTIIDIVLTVKDTLRKTALLASDRSQRQEGKWKAVNEMAIHLLLSRTLLLIIPLTTTPLITKVVAQKNHHK